MLDNLKRFIIKHVPTSPTLKVKEEKPKGYVNWDNIGNDIDSLVSFLKRKANG